MIARDVLRLLQRWLPAGLALGLPAAAMVAGCASGVDRVGPPLTRPLAAGNLQVMRGQEAFMNHCHACHPGGGSGLGPSINATALPEPMIRFQVRNGLGAMPAFGEPVLPDEALDAILSYLRALRDLK